MIKWKYKPSGNCPVQSEGHFMGYYFYFRARHTQATIEFSKSEAGWENELICARYILATESDPYAGWMPKWKCRLLIRIACVLFLFKRKRDPLDNIINKTK